MEDGLERFIEAQNSCNTYKIALHEMQNGQKRSHWIRFIFPQLKGLGHSYNSQYYGIDDFGEAKAYLNHPVPGKRLREMTSVLLNHKDKNVASLMGSHIDAVKLRSCMTLFDAISPNNVFGQILGMFFGGKRDGRTIRKIRGQSIQKGIETI